MENWLNIFTFDPARLINIYIHLLPRVININVLPWDEFLKKKKKKIKAWTERNIWKAFQEFILEICLVELANCLYKMSTFHFRVSYARDFCKYSSNLISCFFFIFSFLPPPVTGNRIDICPSQVTFTLHLTLRGMKVNQTLNE